MRNNFIVKRCSKNLTVLTSPKRLTPLSRGWWFDGLFPMTFKKQRNVKDTLLNTYPPTKTSQKSNMHTLARAQNIVGSCDGKTDALGITAVQSCRHHGHSSLGPLRETITQSSPHRKPTISNTWFTVNTIGHANLHRVRSKTSFVFDLVHFTHNQPLKFSSTTLQKLSKPYLVYYKHSTN